MPVSAPPPSWANLRNKPTTVAGFGISDMATQTVANATNATNATNVTNLTTDQVVAANAGAISGAIGTYGFFAHGASITPNTNASGSALNWSGGHNGSSLSFGNNLVSGGLGGTVAGTWKACGYSQAGNGQTLFLRIA